MIALNALCIFGKPLLKKVKRDQLFIVMEILTPVFLGSREKPEVSKEGAKMHPGYVINLEFSQIWPEW